MIDERGPDAIDGSQFVDEVAGRVGHQCFGLRGGFPVLYFHGWPGSAVEGRLLDAAARALGLDIVVLERPGMGGSGAAAGRCEDIASWAQVAVRFAAFRGWARYGVAAVSGGGPYALAMAVLDPERVAAVTVGCCAARFEFAALNRLMNPFDRLLLECWRRRPGIGVPALNLLKTRLDRRSFAAANWPRTLFLGGPDREVLADPGVQAVLSENLLAALGPGPEGALADLERLFGNWGFEPAFGTEVPVTLSYGVEDRIVRPHEAIASLGCPQSAVSIVPGEGHYSLAIRQTERILRPLEQAVRQEGTKTSGESNASGR